jgi:hypothetical protein
MSRIASAGAGGIRAHAIRSSTFDVTGPSDEVKLGRDDPSNPNPAGQ